MSKSLNLTRLVIVISLLTYTTQSGAQPTTAKVRITNPNSRIILLPPGLRGHQDAFEIELTTPITRSPAVVSLYSLPGVKVFEQTLFPDTPAHTITLSGLSRQLGRLPAGYYFYDVQAPRPVLSTQGSDSLLFRDISDSNLPAGATVASFSRFGDLNGDTFVDLAVSRALALGQPQLLINDGTGRFVNETSGRFPVSEFFTLDLELLDVDFDQDLDIFFVAEDTSSALTESANRLYLNDGNGHFTEVSQTHLPVLRVLSTSAASGFVNDDHFPDLVITGFATADPLETSLFVLINDGTGRFVDESESYLPPDLAYGVFDVALADVNRDERLDIVLANFEMIVTPETGPDPIFIYSGQNAVLIQDEENVYVDETANRMPVDNEVTKLIRTADIDNNGAPEIYLMNLSFLSAVPHVLYLNDGNGVFEDATSARLPQQNIMFLNDVAFEDYDGNGYSDMYLVNINPLGADPAAPDFLNLNQNGFFSDGSGGLPAYSNFGVSAASADIERDGDFDIFVSNGDGAQGPSKDLLLENLSIVVGVPGAPETAPQSFSLLQNYPNPFNPTTTIAYELTKAAEVTLKVYDLQGREVAVLVSARLPADQHRYEWSADDLASGIYYYRLATEGFAATKKLVLIK